MIAELVETKKEELLIKLRQSKDTRDLQFILERCYGEEYCRPEVKNQINLMAIQAGQHGGSIHLTIANWQDAQKQLNLIQAVPDKPGELNPQLPAPAPEEPAE